MSQLPKRTRVWLWVLILCGVLGGGAAAMWFYGRPLLEAMLVQALPEVQTSLSRTAGFPIHMEQLALDRDGLRPVLRADGLRLGLYRKDASTESDCHPGAEWTIERLELSFDIWQALIQRKIQLTRVTARGVNGALEWSNAQKRWTAPALEPLPNGTGGNPGPSTTNAASAAQAIIALGTIRIEHAQLCALQDRERRKLELGSAELSINANASFSEGNLIGALDARQIRITGPEYPAQANQPGLQIPEAKLAWSARLTAQALDQFEIREGAFTLNETDWRLHGKTLEIARPVTFSQLKRVLPRDLIPRSIETFLSTAIHSARADQLRIEIHSRDEWTIHSSVSGVHFEFSETWPPLQEASADLTIRPQGVEIRLRSGKLLGAHFEKTLGKMHWDAKTTTLNLDFAAQFTASALTQWITQGPFRESSADLLKTMTPLSEAQLKGKVEIPLEENSTRTVSSEIQFSGLKLQIISPLQEELENLSGNLDIEVPLAPAKNTPTLSLQWRDLQGLLHAKPWSSHGNAKLGHSTHTLQTHWEGGLDWKKLQEIFPNIAPFPVQGELRTTAQVDLSLPRKDTPNGFTYHAQLETELAGLAIQAPAPLGKKAEEKWKSSFKLQGKGQSLERLTALFPWGDTQIEFDPTGQFAKTESSLRTSEFDAGVWKKWWDSIRPQLKSPPKKEGDPSATSSSHSAELTTELFQWNDRKLHQAKIRFTQKPDLAQLRISSQEATGEMTFEGSGKSSRLKLRFDPLKIPLPENPPTEAAADDSESEPWNWDEIPEVHAFIENLSYGPDRLGTLKLETLKTENRFTVQQAELRGPGIEARLKQGFQTLGLGAKSQFVGEVSFDHFRKSMPRSKSLSGLEIQEGKISFDLDWPGTWDRWAWSKARGTLRGRIRRGVVLGVQNSGLNLLNLVNLNFSDEAKTRVRFNAMEMALDLDRGNLSTKKSKCYVGATFIRLSGKTNLISDRLEFDLLVTPNLQGSTLSRALSLISEEEEEADLEAELYRTEPENAFSKNIRIRGTWAQPKQD